MVPHRFVESCLSRKVSRSHAVILSVQSYKLHKLKLADIVISLFFYAAHFDGRLGIIKLPDAEATK